MRTRIFALLAVFTMALGIFSGCRREPDYLSYISEKRENVYLYADDTAEIKIYCSQKEQPYAADGYKGEMNPLIEIFVTLPKNPEELEVKVGNLGGEMNYQAVENRYYLSFTAEGYTSSSVEVNLTADGESKVYSALSVKYPAVMSCDDAVRCVIEHDGEYFKRLTENGHFNAEIFVRLLYEEQCYYYVGICDKAGNIQAYLIDGEHGKVIAVKSLST